MSAAILQGGGLGRMIIASSSMNPQASRSLVNLLLRSYESSRFGIVAADASEIFDAKVSVPSELRSARWADVPTWIRERAFFMAAVDRAEVLEEFRKASGKILTGDLTVAEARGQLRQQLDRLDYKTLPGQEGTIKDLRTGIRQNVALETNVAQVQGFAKWARQQDALQGFPAQRLVRLRNARVPRNWRDRWDAARARTTSAGATDSSQMVALVNHPIWTELSRFKTPYAPFDYNSGMGLEAEDRETAERLGLLPGRDADPAHAAMMRPHDTGLNATLEASPAVNSAQVRAALAEETRGLAKWEGDRLVFTDPNGSRPYSARDLAQVWAQKLPAGIPHLQRDAVLDWAEDPDSFQDKGNTDRWEDLARAWRRIDRQGALPEGDSDVARALRELAGLSTSDLAKFSNAEGVEP